MPYLYSLAWGIPLSQERVYFIQHPSQDKCSNMAARIHAAIAAAWRAERQYGGRIQISVSAKILFDRTKK